ncbi:MAG: diguanylate cyclase [Gallionellaceae bacterium]
MPNKLAHEVKILAVEDDPGDYGLIRVYLRLSGYGLDLDNDTVTWATNMQEVGKYAERFTPDVILLDLNLPDSSGIETVKAVRKLLPGVPIIVLSGNDDKQLAIAALENGAQDYLVKGHYEHDAMGKAISHTLVRGKLEARLRLFEFALNSAANAIVITDKDNHIEWANPAFTQLTGYPLDEALGHKPSELVKSGKQDSPFYKNLWDTILSGCHWQGELINKRKDGSLYHEELSIAPVRNQRGEIMNYVAIKQDVSERKKAEEEVRLLAFYDPLTHLPNRRLLNDRLTHFIAASKRSGLYGALLFLDLDNFKPLNDVYGHAVGDLLLIEASSRLTNCVREIDTVARFGGDEFVVMLSDLNEDKSLAAEQASSVAEKILSTLSEPYLLIVKKEGSPDTVVEHRCTASIGVTLFNNQNATQDELMKLADLAMYQAKEAGRNRVLFYSADQ